MEEVTKVIEDVDKLFSEIVVNGEAHVSERYVPPAPTSSQSLPQNQNDSQEDNNEDEPAQAVEGEYVDTLNLNGVDHDFRDTPLTALVAQLQQLLSTLQTRLNSLVSDIGAINSKIPAEASTANKLADKNYVGNLISAINALIPTEASTTNKLADKDYVGNLISAITALIPAQASTTNQLADKNFVNSSIATNTANFLGTYSTLAEIEAIPNPTNNDYAFLETADASGNNVYDRYKYSADDNEWLYEYELNNSSFTAEQWATINSGLTQASVENLVDSEITEALTSPTLKQPIFDFIHPVGEVYIQFPLQSDPATLYNQGGIMSTWTEVDYDGAFFRANGGNADPFIASGTLTKQASQNLAHSHTVEAHDHGGYTGYTQPTFSGTKISNQRVGIGKSVNTNLTPTGVFSFSGTGTGVSNLMCNSDNNDSRGVYMNYTPSGTVQNHRHTIESASPATDSNGGTEARPENYTVKVWKRTA